jgi:hypothetical protein
MEISGGIVLRTMRILKRPKEFIGKMTMKQAVFYLVAFAMTAMFLIGFLLGALVV